MCISTGVSPGGFSMEEFNQYLLSQRMLKQRSGPGRCKNVVVNRPRS